MAMGRFNRPSIMVYGGAIAPGHTTLLDTPKVINISTTFEAYEIDRQIYRCQGCGKAFARDGQESYHFGPGQERRHHRSVRGQRQPV